MNYDETLNFLFNRLQSFHNIGAAAYKPGLETTLKLAHAFGNPHLKFRSIHVAGTNGKGSTAHSLAAVLMAAGLKVGLYTSPHLLDFRERMRINGQPVSEREVVDFVAKFQETGPQDLDPSFFELTTIMAFDFFARNKVDVAVVETGLGGRLDSTNIIRPDLSVITNISFDHTSLLGNSLGEIAFEKAGIIKDKAPVVIGRRHPETDAVFAARTTDIVFAPDAPLYTRAQPTGGRILYSGTPWGDISSDLNGPYQPENMQTVLTAVKLLQDRDIFPIADSAVVTGLSDVRASTGLAGRWMVVPGDGIEIVCDTGHNADGWDYLADELKRRAKRPLFVVVGFVNDKDYPSILAKMPAEARYYFVQPDVRRAAPADKVLQAARQAGLQGSAYPDVKSGAQAAVADASRHTDAFVFVGGSTFVVADFLASLPRNF